MAARATKIQDLDFDAVANTTQKHAKDITDLDERLARLECKIGTNEQIAATLCVASEKAAEMQGMFEKTFLKLLAKNDPVRDEIKKLIGDADRSYVQGKLKEYNMWIKAGLLFLVAQISIELVKWLMGLLHSSVTGGTPHP